MTKQQFNTLRRGIYWSLLSIINFIFAIPNGHSTTADGISFGIGVVSLLASMHYLLFKDADEPRP